MTSRVARFDVLLDRTESFDHEVLRLTPTTPGPLLALTAESTRRWPQRRLHAQFDEGVPRVMVGIGRSVELEDAANAAEVLPIADEASQLWWITRSGADPWVTRRRFDLT